MLTIKKHTIPEYETVIEGVDPSCGLHAFIAIHNTSLGPALGGARFFPYSSPQAALSDVLRLAKGMTYKSAIVKNGLGGGKSVVIIDPRRGKSKELLHSFGKLIHSLEGQYITAEDVGSNVDDMLTIREATPYVAALPIESSSGDPSRFTAWGVFKGIQAVSQVLWGSPSVRGKKIAIQGIGNVGHRLARFLFWEGAELILCDLDPKKAHKLALREGAKEVHPKLLLETECDILSPCAMGGVLNENSIPKLKCKAVAGSANNQLQSDADGALLFKKGIVYAPDFVINSGGIINAAAEFEEDGYQPSVSRDRVNGIYETLLDVFKQSEEKGVSPNVIAQKIAEKNLKKGVGKRSIPLKFPHI